MISESKKSSLEKMLQIICLMSWTTSESNSELIKNGFT